MKNFIRKYGGYIGTGMFLTNVVLAVIIGDYSLALAYLVCASLNIMLVIQQDIINRQN